MSKYLYGIFCRYEMATQVTQTQKVVQRRSGFGNFDEFYHEREKGKII